MRRKFEEQLLQLNRALVEMGEMVKQAITDAIRALITQDVELANRIIAADDNVDSKEDEIEALCIQIILQQQPVARDLRQITSVMKIITDLERIGDHASDISEITNYLADKQFIKKLDHIPKMAEATVKMVTDSIEAFVQNNLELAKSVIEYDDVVDDLFTAVKNDLIALINSDAKTGDQALDLLMIAKYFERIGDHATNVAEWVVFSLTGRHKNHKVM